MKTAVIFSLIMVPMIALAQVPPDSGIGFLDMIMHYLNGVEAGVIASIIAMVEIVLRLVPTTVPLSLFAVVKKGLDVVIWILKFASEFLGKLVAVGNRLKKK